MRVSTLLTTTASIDGAYKAMCQPVLARFHLQQIPFDILMCLANNPGSYTAAQISSLRHLKPSVVSHYVDMMVHDGLLLREAVHGDRRKIRLNLTEKARPIVEHGKSMQAEFYNAMTQGLTQEELNIFRHCVSVATENANHIRMQAKGTTELEVEKC